MTAPDRPQTASPGRPRPPETWDRLAKIVEARPDLAGLGLTVLTESAAWSA